MTRLLALLVLALVAWAVLRALWRGREPRAEADLRSRIDADPMYALPWAEFTTHPRVRKAIYTEPDDGIQTDSALWARARGEGA